MRHLRISEHLALSADFVTSTAGIFATKGQGKSFLSQVIAEEMLEGGQVIVAIDPTDVWSGLRSSADGKNDGYAILVIGGDHGDLKLDPEPGAGTRLAEAIVAERFSCVICTDGIDDTRAIRYVREVLETLYRKNREPIHVFVDECDLFAPQQPKEEEDYRCIRAMAHVVRRGRKKGIGTTLITQRPSELNASVRSQVEMLFVLGMLHHLDIDAVEKWLRLRKKKRGDNAAFVLQEEMIDSLDSLPRGDAWVWAPRLKIHKRFRARAKRTFDSGATPKPGQKVHAAKRLAPVDIQRLGAAIAEAAERQKENDPAELKRQVAVLRRELDRLGRGQVGAEVSERQGLAETHDLRARVLELERTLIAARRAKEKIVVKEVQVVRAADLRRLENFVKKIDGLARRVTGTGADLERHLSGLRAEATKLRDVVVHVTQLRDPKAVAVIEGGVARLTPTRDPGVSPLVEGGVARLTPTRDPGVSPLIEGGVAQSTSTRGPGVSPLVEKGAAPPGPIVAPIVRPPANAHERHERRARDERKGAVSPGGLPTATNDANVADEQAFFPKPAHLRLLSAIAWWESVGVSAPDLGGVAFVAKTSAKSSAFANNRSRLRVAGCIDYPSSGCVQLTARGRSLAPPPVLPSTNEALHEAILQKITPAHGRMLRALISVYPEELSLEEFAKQAGASSRSSAFANNRSWLRARGLAEYPRVGFVRASALLFPGAS